MNIQKVLDVNIVTHTHHLKRYHPPWVDNMLSHGIKRHDWRVVFTELREKRQICIKQPPSLSGFCEKTQPAISLALNSFLVTNYPLRHWRQFYGVS
jgi:hypothetical protein